ncbi:MAG: type II secretion system secretin GspD [Kiritimatiellae bacterium]|nr:type II secretion system secretin GspD [Kiritimatiellia bacterium]
MTNKHSWKLIWMMGALALFACAIEAQTPVPGRSAIPAPRALGQRRPLIGGRNPQPGAEQQGGGDSKVPMAPNTVKHFGDQLPDDTKTTMPALKFEQADAQFLMEAYAAEVGRTLLIAPDLPKVTGITLRSSRGVPLTREEYLEAIEISLAMNGISLEQFGDKFIKALPSKSIRTSGIKIMMEKPEGGHPEQGRTVSQMIQLKSITISEAQKALEGFKRPDGLIQAFERTNSLLVTDTQENVNRMLEIVRFIDQPMIATEEVNVRSIVHAKAADIKKVLEEIVTESQKQTQSKEEVKQNTSGSPGFTRTTPTPTPTLAPRTIPGIRRPEQPAAPVSTPNANIEALMSDADRGMIRGKVQIIADERSNQLIIITRKENMNFFDKIITVLDIETDPDVKATVRRLEFAEAEEVASMLNDLIGNASSRSNDSSNRSNTSGTNANANREQPGGGHHTGVGGVPKSTSLNDAAKARSSGTRTSSGDTGAAGLGQITKDDIKILADKRTNAIVMMGTPAAIAAILEVIDSMDIQLSQVLIETVVIQVQLGDELTTGIDWIKTGKRGHTETTTTTGTDSDGNETTVTKTTHSTIRDALFRNGDQMGGGGGTHSSMLESLVGLGADATTNLSSSLAGAGLNYFLKSDKLQISALIEAAKSDSRTKVLSSPILMTVDNKEATIEATDMRYLYKGVRYSGSSYNGTEVPDYEQRDIGLTVKVTPRISPNGMVVLTIEETFETIGANQQVGNESYPTVTTRKLSADVSVENMQTVVLGGLVQNEVKKSETGIPILKDIPVVGKYLFGSTTSTDTRSELLVFMTPYVFNDSRSLLEEAQRRKNSLSDPRPWIDYGWSASPLADPMSKDEKMRRVKEKWREQDRDYNANKTYEKLLKAREDQLRRRSELDAHNAWKELEREDRKYAPASGDTSWVRDVRTSDRVEVFNPAETKEAPPPASKQEDGSPVEPIL